MSQVIDVNYTMKQPPVLNIGRTINETVRNFNQQVRQAHDERMRSEALQNATEKGVLAIAEFVRAVLKSVATLVVGVFLTLFVIAAVSYLTHTIWGKDVSVQAQTAPAIAGGVKEVK